MTYYTLEPDDNASTLEPMHADVDHPCYCAECDDARLRELADGWCWS